MGIVTQMIVMCADDYDFVATLTLNPGKHIAHGKFLMYSIAKHRDGVGMHLKRFFLLTLGAINLEGLVI